MSVCSAITVQRSMHFKTYFTALQRILQHEVHSTSLKVLHFTWSIMYSAYSLNGIPYALQVCPVHMQYWLQIHCKYTAVILQTDMGYNIHKNIKIPKRRTFHKLCKDISKIAVCFFIYRETTKGVSIIILLLLSNWALYWSTGIRSETVFKPDSLHHIWLRFVSSGMNKESGLNPTPSHQISYNIPQSFSFCKIDWQ